MPFLILVIIICMIVALFAVQNAVAVSLNFVFWSFSASLVLVILGAFLMGVLVATYFLLTMKAKHYLKDKKMREEMQQLQAENKRLQERVAMLQHTQLLHNEAAQAEAAKQEAEPAAAEKTSAESGSRQ